MQIKLVHMLYRPQNTKVMWKTFILLFFYGLNRRKTHIHIS